MQRKLNLKAKQSGEQRKHPREYTHRNAHVTRYGRWILARRKLVDHLENGWADYRLDK